MSDTPIIAYKGFNKDFSCRGFKYEIGKTYIHEGEVEICTSGFHGCEFSLDVFGYYPLGESRFARIELSGDVRRHDSDSKIAAAKITITAELTIPELVKAGVDWILKNIKDTNKKSDTGNQSAATNTGYQSAATNTGYQSAAEVSGNDSVAIATGYESKARASKGSAIVVCERDGSGKLLSVVSGIAGEGNIKPDIWYTAKNGKFVEIESNAARTPGVRTP